MTLSSEQRSASQVRSYRRTDSVVFLKTKEAFGGLSNMASGYPLEVNGVRILTSEALYQACRFPDLPDVQRKIIEQVSPMSAKMVGKPFRDKTRPDWDWVRMNIMRWSLRVKLAQNWKKYGDLLLETGSRPIVEESRKDEFWGAKPVDENTLVGMNVLGRLLMELREEFKKDDRDKLKRVEPLKIPRFRLFGESIRVVDELASKDLPATQVKSATAESIIEQRELVFDQAPVTAEKSETLRPHFLESLGPYPAYRNSGQLWLGLVPAHWEVRRAKFALREVDLRSGTGKEQLLRVSQYTGVTQRKIVEGSEAPDTRAASLVGYKRVAPNDLVINIMLAWNGSLGVSRYEGLVSPAYCVYRFKEDLRPWYFHELLRTPVYKERIKAASTGVVESRLRLYSDDLGRIEFPLPPESEQAAIVRFLAYTNGRLERAIRAKRKVIALLQEQKQAIIHRAVTRGLDPTVPLKPSGIPWLVDIPQHWKRIRLKFEASHIVDCLHATPTYRADGVYPAIRTADIEPGRVRLEQARKIAPSEFRKWIERLKPEEGDILYSREGERFGIAANVPPATELCISQRMMVFRIRKPHNSEYVMWQLNCQHVYLQASLYVMGSTAPHVNVEQIKNFQLALPPVDEQNAITAHIRSECRTVNTAIARLDREIELLREYRTRLVADVVTGKLDVNRVANQLPTEPISIEPQSDSVESLETESDTEINSDSGEVEA